jgi:hypothetical protein
MHQQRDRFAHQGFTAGSGENRFTLSQQQHYPAACRQAIAGGWGHSIVHSDLPY